ncbi:MAG: hypothetical protein KBC48_02245 [Candidatus Pacebacteria bacterium]|nr:hypothetical protein [Candidatus Paceibacterota bacterium]
MMNFDVFSLVAMIAETIGHCDFRVTVQRYMLGNDYPWIITVGEGTWQRHLVVESIAPDGKNATFAVLSHTQSDKFGYDINTLDVVNRLTLRELIGTENKYSNVKKALLPPKAA